MRRKDREITSSSELNEIFREADVCRIALIDGNVPYIVAMNFGYSEQDNSIYFHSAKEGRKLDLISKNNNACFQIDTAHELLESDIACNFSMNYKSIVGTGIISIVEDEQERKRGLNVIMEHYTGKDNFVFDDEILNMTCILKLEIEEMTGKKKG